MGRREDVRDLEVLPVGGDTSWWVSADAAPAEPGGAPRRRRRWPLLVALAVLAAVVAGWALYGANARTALRSLDGTWREAEAVDAEAAHAFDRVRSFVGFEDRDAVRPALVAVFDEQRRRLASLAVTASSVTVADAGVRDARAAAAKALRLRSQEASAAAQQARLGRIDPTGALARTVRDATEAAEKSLARERDRWGVDSTKATPVRFTGYETHLRALRRVTDVETGMRLVLSGRQGLASLDVDRAKVRWLDRTRGDDASASYLPRDGWGVVMRPTREAAPTVDAVWGPDRLSQPLHALGTGWAFPSVRGDTVWIASDDGHEVRESTRDGVLVTGRTAVPEGWVIVGAATDGGLAVARETGDDWTSWGLWQPGEADVRYELPPRSNPVAASGRTLLRAACDDETGRCTLVLTDAVTRTDRPVALPVEARNFIGTFSPGGDRVVVAWFGSDQGVALIDVTTATAQVLETESRLPTGGIDFAWSSDGRWIVAVDSGASRGRLWDARDGSLHPFRLRAAFGAATQFWAVDAL